MEKSPLASELDEMLTVTTLPWEKLRNARIFITGGTGFWGSWLLESLVYANEKLGLRAQAVILTRNEEVFRKKCPHLADASGIFFHHGDVRSFRYPEGQFTHVIHAATEASDQLNRENPGLMRDVIVSGTRRTLEFAAQSGARQFLLASSGAVYGRQRPEITHIEEDDSGLTGPLSLSSAYAEGKREAERLGLAFSSPGLSLKIARGFAFVGPYLPLDTHFAIGNFIRDALRETLIVIKGDGTPYRSYLYGSDLAVWLWTILLKGKTGRAYNVGSERRVNVGELAQIVAAQLNPRLEIRIAQKPVLGQTPEQYVPSTKRAKTELGLRETVSLEEAIVRTAHWAQMTGLSKHVA